MLRETKSNKLKLENNNIRISSMNKRSYKKKSRRGTNGTKKTKRRVNLKAMWNKFDTAKTDEDSVGDGTGKVECVYVQSDNFIEKDECPTCGDKIQITEEGFRACSNKKCGILYKDTLDESAEWRFYGANDSNSSDPTRCGMPINPLLQESSYGCKVGGGYNASYEMKKIRRYTEWQSMPYKEKAHYDEFERIKIMANNSGIPKIIVDDALRYHKKISEQKTFRALNRDGIIAASIYISCRVNDYPRTAREIAVIFHLDNGSATKGCKNAVTILNKLEKDMDGRDKTHLCQTKPIDFIERFCSKLEINKELTKLAQFIALRIEKNHLMPENTPHSVAAGIVFFIASNCGLNITKFEVKKVSEISEVTINKCFKKLDTMKEMLLPSIIRTKYGIE